MRSTKLFVLVLLSAIAPASYAGCPITNVRQFAEAVADAHKHNALEAIDRKYAGKNRFKVIIENSLAENDAFERTTATRFAEVARWLKRRQVEGFPAPDIRKLVECKNGVCVFDLNEGIDHNTLYLEEIHYEGRPTCAKLQSIKFLDGD